MFNWLKKKTISTNYYPPYRVGKKQKRAVLDSKGILVVLFEKGKEDMAKEYCEFLNKKTQNIVNNF